jgi:hypothetical protein
MLVRLTTRMHNRPREALEEHRIQHVAETDARRPERFFIPV